MRSIRTHLILRLVCGSFLLIALAGIGLYAYIEETLEHQLDAALITKAQLIANSVHMEDDAKPHFQSTDISLSNPGHRHEESFFQIWQADGSTLVRSLPAGVDDLSVAHEMRPHRRFCDVPLANGSVYRVTELQFDAQPDEDQFDSPKPASQPAAAHLHLVIAQSRDSIDGPLSILMGAVAAYSIVTAIGTVGIASWSVRRGLIPLTRISILADQISADSLNIRFPSPAALPLELRPISARLNDLLFRLGAAFDREKRFSAAVAHELRTPLAELRSACDVALRWPDDASGLSTALTEARDVTIQMSELVQTLLSLVRHSEGVESAIRKDVINLQAAITNAFPQMAKVASARQLTVDYKIDAAATVVADPTLFRVVLANLLENAVDYTSERGKLLVQTDSPSDHRWTVKFINTCDGLTNESLPRLFEPFWREDASRIDRRHVGLGLTLVQTYCELLDILITSQLTVDGNFQIELRIAEAESRGSAP